MPVIITNKHNLPEVFVQACKIDRHITAGDISVTGLIDSPQPRLLKNLHTIEQDVSEMIDMLFGTAIHHVLERSEVKHFYARQLMDAANVLEELGKIPAAEKIRLLARETYPTAFNSDDLIEKTLVIEVDGLTISGTLDKYVAGSKMLQDYKSASVYAYIYEESKKKWYEQVNIYAYMLREHGYPVEQAEIITIFKDWSRMGLMKQKSTYPPQKVMSIPIKLVDHDQVLKYIKSRVARHKKAMETGVASCTPKERWSTADSYAVYGKNKAKAVKILPDEDSAIKFTQDNALKYGKMEVQLRPGEQKRCESFCAVREVCPQYKEIKALRQEVNEEPMSGVDVDKYIGNI